MQTPPQPDAPHDWIGALTSPLTPREARLAVLRGSIHLSKGGRVDALEVYCGRCRRRYEDVADTPCSALMNNEHLRGGPIGTRKRRGKDDDGACCIDPAACYHDKPAAVAV